MVFYRHVSPFDITYFRKTAAEAGNEFDDAAYNMAAVTATIALYRALVRKGVLAREAAISRSIEAEALRQEPGASKTTMEINDQSFEVLKFIAEHL